jgi:hypothetical protein
MARFQVIARGPKTGADSYHECDTRAEAQVHADELIGTELVATEWLNGVEVRGEVIDVIDSAWVEELV